MLAYTREKLLSYLEETSALVDLYQQRDPSFPTTVVTWLTRVEVSLGELRLPMRSLVAAERGRILAMRDGLRDPAIGGERLTSRRATFAVSSLALGRVEGVLRGRVSEIDTCLAAWREKMAQFVAVASAKAPIPLPATEPKSAWLATVWKGFSVNGDIEGMYRYLNAAIQPSDRLFLLEEVLGNLLDTL